MMQTVSVRNLAEFCCKSGSLDLRFTPAPSGLEGIEGHQAIYSRRSDNYQSEISLVYQYQQLLCVRGRADGYDRDRHRIEEIKTYRGQLTRLPDNHKALHWAQARLYAAIYCEQHRHSEIGVALVYWHVDQKKETIEEKCFSAEELKLFLDDCVRVFMEWSRQLEVAMQQRSQLLEQLSFPYPEFRTGQRDFAESVYKAFRLQKKLIIEAPTGIGKTLAALFPALKAMMSGKFDKLVFLTAKTPGRVLVREALKKLQLDQSRVLRVVEMKARDKVCEHPDLACHGDSCPLANGFYDRLREARQAAFANAWLMADDVGDIASRFQVCPYYLAQEMLKWSDVLIADYNYWFDISAQIYGLSKANEWYTGLLIDEAHNLLDRGRSMYSAELSRKELLAARKIHNHAGRKILERLNRRWLKIEKQWPEGVHISGSLDKDLIGCLSRFVSDYSEYLTDEYEHGVLPQQHLEFYFSVIQFMGVAELFNHHFVMETEVEKTHAAIRLLNQIPAELLRERFAAAQSSVVFSGTLTPFAFFKDTLGLGEDCPVQQIASPFSAQQLNIKVITDISTRYLDRERSVDSVIDIIRCQLQRCPGNYLVFFSSFAYLEQVGSRLQHVVKDHRIIRQAASMSESERTEFMAAFDQKINTLGLVVLGGAFGEGVDLPGEQLIGAFILTLGLPQLNQRNEALKKNMHQVFGHGYEYAYLFPGLQKVIQAAGRVIRGVNDSGYLILIDDRFFRANIQRLLPDWWRINNVTTQQFLNHQ
ncbi:ATP-dependent DNA helicase [Gynuella sp.]|uniref:ATP-dependent DNA helicase n=1 Tax=Gynuella sp. TaxID=2969146 RepID=UPI003D14370E